VNLRADDMLDRTDCVLPDKQSSAAINDLCSLIRKHALTIFRRKIVKLLPPINEHCAREMLDALKTLRSFRIGLILSTN
jgi:hypothetical protein